MLNELESCDVEGHIFDSPDRQVEHKNLSCSEDRTHIRKIPTIQHNYLCASHIRRRMCQKYSNEMHYPSSSSE